MKVLIVDRYAADVATQLKNNYGCDVQIAAGLQPTAQELSTCEILLIRSRTLVDKTLFDSSPHLKLIVTATAGFDHIKIKQIPSHVRVAHTPEANTESAAELTLLFLLALARGLPATQTVMRARKWKDQLSSSRNLKGQHVGLLGFGRIGQRVAEIIRPLGAHVAAYDPYQSESAFKRFDVERLGLTELFTQSDFLSLHVPLTKETHHIIRRSTIELMPDHIQIINTSRGSVISECELVQALELGEVAGAALDVFENEPLSKDSPLFNLPQVLMTPHVGAFTDEALTQASAEAVKRVAEFLKGEEVQNPVPPRADWAQFLF